MGFELTCPQGHRITVDLAETGPAVRCPLCNLVVEVPEDLRQRGNDTEEDDFPQPAARSLWDVMRHGGSAGQISRDTPDTASPSTRPEAEVHNEEPAATEPAAVHSPVVAQDDQSPTNQASPKGLWAVMRGTVRHDGDADLSSSEENAGLDDGAGSAVQSGEFPASRLGRDVGTADAPPVEDAAIDGNEGAAEQSSTPRGLWGLMRQSPPQTSDAPVDTTASETEAALDDVRDSAESLPRPEADLNFRPLAGTGIADIDDQLGLDLENPAVVGAYEAAFGRDDEAEENALSWNDDSSRLDFSPTGEMVALGGSPVAFEDLTMRTIVQRSAKSGRSRNGMAALVLGLLAVPLAALGMLAPFWTKLPATAAGLLAMVFGMLAINEIRVSRGRMTGVVPARLGMLLGLAGIFLSPMVFHSIGEKHRRNSGREQTLSNMEVIGIALSAYHDAYRRFPAGGIFGVDSDGKDLPLHGWTSSLLPYMGHDDVFNRIDFAQPYDSLDNHEAMSRIIPQFLAAGVQQHRNGSGLGLTHFAGVGGEFNDPLQGLLPVGVFGRNSTVTRNDVSDGLSHTLVAGEIANLYPAWGEPDNWRNISEGLNKDYYGFGNALGTGAVFLKADGSVRFFSNETSPRILQQLSTRSGGEPIPDEDR